MAWRWPLGHVFIVFSSASGCAMRHAPCAMRHAPCASLSCHASGRLVPPREVPVPLRPQARQYGGRVLEFGIVQMLLRIRSHFLSLPYFLSLQLCPAFPFSGFGCALYRSNIAARSCVVGSGSAYSPVCEVSYSPSQNRRFGTGSRSQGSTALITLGSMLVINPRSPVMASRSS